MLLSDFKGKNFDLSLMTRGGDSSDCTEVHEKTVVNKYFQFKLFDNKFVMKFAITVKKTIMSKLIGQ